MRVLIAIDSFKGSLTSMKANQIVAEQFQQQGFAASQVAIADGGEGTVAAYLKNHPGGIQQTVPTVDPAQRPIKASYGYYPVERLAVIEVAAASGIQYQQPGVTPAETNSYGTGLVIKAALKQGAQKLIIGLGGSLTVDGGAGILRALGWQFYDQQHKSLRMTGADLGRVVAVQPPANLEQLRKIEFISANDVVNPLTGSQGATAIFGPQKGLPTGEITTYDLTMRHWQQALAADVTNTPGDGAAGGIGFALRVALGAKMQSGFQLVAQAAQLTDKVAEADLVVSGEGHLDEQSLFGKVPIQISELAQTHHKPCVLFVGAQAGSLANFASHGVTSVFPIVDQPQSLATAIANGRPNLARTAERVARLLTAWQKS